MKTLQELLDDLDAIVDNGTAPKHEVRSLIAFVAREVAAFEDTHASTVSDNAKLRDAKSKVDAELADLKASNAQASDDFLRNELRKQAEAGKRNTLHYD